MKELKPCPFCDSEPILDLSSVNNYSVYSVYCDNCSLATGYCETEDEAMEEWNKLVKEENISKKQIRDVRYQASYNPCDDCQYSYSKNGQEMSECKICEFNRFLQAEKAGKILVVQCSIGDRVFEVQEMRNWIQEYIVTSIHVSNHTIHYSWKIDWESGGIYGNLKGFNSSDIEERVFLSRKEAEARLARIREE